MSCLEINNPVIEIFPVVGKTANVETAGKETLNLIPTGLPGPAGAQLLQLTEVPTFLEIGQLGQLGPDIYFSAGTEIRKIPSEFVSLIGGGAGEGAWWFDTEDQSGQILTAGF